MKSSRGWPARKPAAMRARNSSSAAAVTAAAAGRPRAVRGQRSVGLRLRAAGGGRLARGCPAGLRAARASALRAARRLAALLQLLRQQAGLAAAVRAARMVRSNRRRGRAGRAAAGRWPPRAARRRARPGPRCRASPAPSPATRARGRGPACRAARPAGRPAAAALRCAGVRRPPGGGQQAQQREQHPGQRQRRLRPVPVQAAQREQRVAGLDGAGEVQAVAQRREPLGLANVDVEQIEREAEQGGGRRPQQGHEAPAAPLGHQQPRMQQHQRAAEVALLNRQTPISRP